MGIDKPDVVSWDTFLNYCDSVVIIHIWSILFRNSTLYERNYALLCKWFSSIIL
jgi:hypothetical protein